MKNGNTFLLKVKKGNFVLNEVVILKKWLRIKSKCKKKFVKKNLWKQILGVVRIN